MCRTKRGAGREIKAMRPWLLLLLLDLLASGTQAATPLRVTAWDLTPAAQGPADGGRLSKERLGELAASLRALDPDVVYLSGLPSSAACEQLLRHLGPATYHLAVCSAFAGAPGNDGPGRELAILSKEPPFAFQAIDWAKVGLGNIPGGFVFAGFRYGREPICLYGLQLEATPGGTRLPAANELSARGLELCSKYLTRHMSWVDQKLTNQLVGWIVTGQLRSSPPLRDDPNLGQLLERTGFFSLARRVEFNGRTTSSGQPAHPVGAFAEVLARNAALAATPHVGYWPWTARYPVTYELTLDRGLATAQGLSGMARFVPGDRRVWLVGLAAAVGLLALSAAAWYAWKRRWADEDSSGALAVQSNPPFLIFEQGVPAPATSALPHSWAGSSAGGSAWQERALRAEQRAEHATAVLRQGVVAQLADWMKQKILVGLVSQRQTLLDVSRTGSAHLVDLESRLSRIQVQFQERISAQQQRISELEREIAAKEKIIQDFLRQRG